jgi:hypothetical protein
MIESGSGQDRELEIGYAFLVGNQAEEKGYGLYSYLLFGSPPTEANKNLYLKTISACIKMMPNIKRFEEGGFHRRELNVTYIPIHKPVPTTKDGISPEEVLKNYNYVRARLLLRNLPGVYRNGPYIISTLNPLSSHQDLSEGYLLQDLSRIPPTRSDLIYAWVKEFLERVSRPGPKNGETLTLFVIKLRTAISIVAEHLPEVQSAVSSWVAWIK